MTMTQVALNEIVRLHKLWLISDPAGKKADLRSADLRSADLRSADLSFADLDYSCWGFSCKTNHVKVCAKIAAQLAAHFCVLDCKDKGYLKARKAILAFAKTSHRAADLGLKKDGAK